MDGFSFDITITMLFIALTTYLLTRYLYFSISGGATYKRFFKIIDTEDKPNSSIRFLWLLSVCLLTTSLFLAIRGVDLKNIDFMTNQSYFFVNLQNIIISIIFSALMLTVFGKLTNLWAFTSNKKRKTKENTP